MIKTIDLTPEVYYSHSRDFQLLGRIIDFVINYLKNTSGVVENNIIGENFDPYLIDLLTTTLGFRKVHEYNTYELIAFCASFSSILKNKGNMNSIYQVLNLIANVQNVKEEVIPSYDSTEHVLRVFLPEGLKEYSLLEDVLDYILPAGISFQIIAAPLTLDKETDIYTTTNAQDSFTRKTLDYPQLIKYESGDETIQHAGTEPYKMDNITVVPAPENN